LTWLSLLKRLPSSHHGPHDEDLNSRELDAREFEASLTLLADDRYRAKKPSWTSAQRLELMLQTDVFPTVAALLSPPPNSSPLLTGPTEPNRTLSEYVQNPAVHSLLRSHHQELLADYRNAAHTYSSNRTHGGLTVDGFLHIMKDRKMFPVAPKSKLVSLFAAQCAESADPLRDPHREPEVSVETFERCLMAVADMVYGDPLYRDKFPTPEARIKKLLNKMYFIPSS